MKLKFPSDLFNPSQITKYEPGGEIKTELQARELLRKMRDIGVYNGPIDGQMGPKSRAAYKKYREWISNIDPNVGPPTIERYPRVPDIMPANRSLYSLPRFNWTIPSTLLGYHPGQRDE